MRGFDALTHLYLPPLRDDLDAVCARARAAGVDGWLVAGSDPTTWAETTAVAHASGGTLALGLHPWHAGLETHDLGAVMNALDQADPACVGEIGLDHHHARSDGARAQQRIAFRAQLAWARARDRPVVIHAVRAVPEVLHVLARDGLPSQGGFIHGWHGDAPLALQAIGLGLHLSIGPLALGRTPHKIASTLRDVPRQRILLETDAPEQRMPGRPVPEPSDLPRIAAWAAEIWRCPPHSVLSQTGSNARALLNPPAPKSGPRG